MARARTRITKKTLANGTTIERTEIVPASDLEWQVQAEAVRRCRSIPGYGDDAGDDVMFTLAGDFNAGRRSHQESVKAKATGIAAGEEDLRFYGAGGRVLLVEMKGPNGTVTAEQKRRHALHRHLGFRVEVVRGKSKDDGANAVVKLVTDWLAESRHTAH